MSKDRKVELVLEQKVKIETTLGNRPHMWLMCTNGRRQLRYDCVRNKMTKTQYVQP